MPSICISAGEVSGDLHGASLVREMQKQVRDLEFFGMGGNEMKSAGVELRYHIDRMGIVGVTEAFKQLRFITKMLRELRTLMEERHPDLVILIDYPGFNLRLARIASQLSIPVLYYIAPQVWAWGARRMKTIAQYVDRVAVILPFEAELYTRVGVQAEFVGHPLLERLETTFDREAFLCRHNLKDSELLLGLLPGSRSSEIRRLLPIMLESAEIVQSEIGDVQIVIAAASSKDVHQIEEIIHEHNMSVPVIQGATHEVMNHSDLLLIASGTATLEAACYGTPSLLLYKVSLISWCLARIMVKVPHIGLVNIVAGKEIVPEFIQFQVVPARVASHAILLLKDKKRRQRMRDEMLNVRGRLGEAGASAKTARLALDLMKKAGGPLPGGGVGS
jgi:lipid-A-disaccharide synthase